ncbi:MAG: DUF3267 domain-containing protein [Anaerolineae bacterium]
MTTIPNIDNKVIPVSTLDFRDNQQLVMLSYVLRIIGAIAFSALFFSLVTRYYPNEALSLQSLFTIKLADVPDIVSIGLIVLDVVFVLWLHELIHATTFFLHTGAPPRMGIRGAMIVASAQGLLNTRHAMMVNALAPFVIISVLGLVMMFVIPLSVLAWVFIPTVVNVAAAGDDFMAVYR